jgi:hypothetical protein
MALVPNKGKEIADAASEEKDFDLRNLVGQELSEAEKKELHKYDISCGYQPGAMLFGGIDEEALGCIRDCTGAKVIDTLSKSVGFRSSKPILAATDDNISSVVCFIPSLR